MSIKLSFFTLIFAVLLHQTEQQWEVCTNNNYIRGWAGLANIFEHTHRSQSPLSMSIPNLKSIVQMAQKLWPFAISKMTIIRQLGFWDFVIFDNVDRSHSSLSMYIPNLKFLAQTVQTLWPIVEIQDGRRPPYWILRFRHFWPHGQLPLIIVYVHTKF